MKYLCLVYGEERTFTEMPEREYDELIREHLVFDGELKAGGHFLAAEALESVTTATMVRVRNGRISVTDGPFAETKEQLTGFFLIDARDLNQAIQIASRIPAARMAGIEVRPIRELQ